LTPKSSLDSEPKTKKEEEPLPLEFLHSFEEDLFEDFGNTSNYLCQKRPPVSITPFEPYEKEFLQETIKELTTFMSDEWLREGESSSDPLQISHPSSLIWCRIRDQNVEALYNQNVEALCSPAIAANIMSDNFALALLSSAALTPMGRTLRGPSGSLVGSYGAIQNVSVWHKDVKASIDFHVFEIPNFDVFIGHLVRNLLMDVPDSGSFSIRLGKESLSVPITRATNSLVEISPIIEPVEEVLDISPLDSPESTLEKEAEQEFIQEDEDSDEVLELPEFEMST
jgi:hypothetical protein